MARINELFAVDAEARASQLGCVARHLLRQQRSKPLLPLIPQEIETVKANELHASTLGKAAAYTLALWGKPTRFLDHPELELSTNLTENSMRPLVVGR